MLKPIPLPFGFSLVFALLIGAIKAWTPDHNGVTSVGLQSRSDGVQAKDGRLYFAVQGQLSESVVLWMLDQDAAPHSVKVLPPSKGQWVQYIRSIGPPPPMKTADAGVIYVSRSGTVHYLSTELEPWSLASGLRVGFPSLEDMATLTYLGRPVALEEHNIVCLPSVILEISDVDPLLAEMVCADVVDREVVFVSSTTSGDRVSFRRTVLAHGPTGVAVATTENIFGPHSKLSYWNADSTELDEVVPWRDGYMIHSVAMPPDQPGGKVAICALFLNSAFTSEWLNCSVQSHSRTAWTGAIAQSSYSWPVGLGRSVYKGPLILSSPEGSLLYWRPARGSFPASVDAFRFSGELGDADPELTSLWTVPLPESTGFSRPDSTVAFSSCGAHVLLIQGLDRWGLVSGVGAVYSGRRSINGESYAVATRDKCFLVHGGFFGLLVE